VNQDFLMEVPEDSTPAILRQKGNGIEALRQGLEKRIVLDRLKLEISVRPFGLVATLGDGVVWVNHAITPDWQRYRDVNGFMDHVAHTLVQLYAEQRFLKKK
jgi:hypothetical protein